ncbi:MAG: deoxyguanosinetriphosphate triphosphohydrolase [Armatimonadota bacterium]
MTIRERTEELERRTLSRHAALSAASRGRARSEQEDPVRTVYQRDRDRIIHTCKAFRRLSRKTQVFIAPEQDHYRTRLTHTLEVAQIGRTIAKGLRLNEDLTEAIALAHDVGHTPFGHAGEWALDEAYRDYDARATFAHHEHSLRVVDVLENEGLGLNLTAETREGILAHTKGERDTAEALEEDQPSTVEAMVIRLADRIAYVNHDIDDSIRAGLLTQEDLPRDCRRELGETHSQRIGTMVQDIIERSADQPRLFMRPQIVRALDDLKDFLFERVYTDEVAAKPENERVRALIRHLFGHYMEHPDELAEGFAPAADTRESIARSVCDYIAGMTDRFARGKYLELFVPRGFR